MSLLRSRHHTHGKYFKVSAVLEKPHSIKPAQSSRHASPQVFAGNRDRTVVAWEPPKDALEETVALTGHTGWVRALATCGQWLFSGSCSTLRQWDMSRAVPRLLRDVKLDKGDIQSLTAGNNSVYACSADGSIQCVSFCILPFIQ